MFAFFLALLALRRRRGVPALALLLGLAWLLSGEIAQTVGINNVGERVSGQPPDPAQLGRHRRSRPPGDLSRSGDRGSQRRVADRVLESVARPGRQPRRNRVRPRPGVPPARRLSERAALGDQHALRARRNGVTLAATPVAHQGHMVALLSPSGRWHLLDNVEQQYSDGWCPSTAPTPTSSPTSAASSR